MNEDENLQEAQDRIYELENQLGAEKADHENTEFRLQNMESERDELRYELEHVRRDLDEARRQILALDAELYSARQEARRTSSWVY